VFDDVQGADCVELATDRGYASLRKNRTWLVRLAMQGVNSLSQPTSIT
jgi:hypothetical protein